MVYSPAFVLLDVCRAWARVIMPVVVDRSNSSFYIIAFGAVEVFLIRACFVCTPTWYRLKIVFLPDLIKKITSAGEVVKNVYNFGWIRTWKNKKIISDKILIGYAPTTTYNNDGQPSKEINKYSVSIWDRGFESHSFFFSLLFLGWGFYVISITSLRTSPLLSWYSRCIPKPAIIVQKTE